MELSVSRVPNGISVVVRDVTGRVVGRVVKRSWGSTVSWSVTTSADWGWSAAQALVDRLATVDVDMSLDEIMEVVR